MTGSFANKKELMFIITLGAGTFGSSNNNQITLQGLRAIAEIDNSGGPAMGTLRAHIYGVSQADMNSITTLQWKPNSIIPNTIQVYAIDGPAQTLIFAGNIVNAWGDYQNMPDVSLYIQSQAAFISQLQPVPPRSFNGTIDVASVMAGIASDMQLAFENNGVNVQMQNVYLPNTLTEQAKSLAQQAGIWLCIDKDTLAIMPANGTRGGLIPEISPQTGMVGYPTFDSVGVNFKCLFNPAVKFLGQINLKTDIPRAAGQWTVGSLNYLLESEKPNGAWFMQIRGINGIPAS